VSTTTDPAAGTVLVIDDDRACRSMLLTALETAGIPTVGAGTGAEALALLAVVQVDAVLLDLALPDMTGFELLRALKSDDATRGVPVIIVTGRTGTRDCVEGLALGAHDFVRKPYPLDELLARVEGALALHRRLASLERETAALEELALTDSLTGLDNRRSAERHLERLAAHAQRTGSSVGLLVVDIDRFKALNDRHGHEVGDEVLRCIAERLRTTARTGDVVARWGGEEFVLILPDTDRSSAALAAERLCASVRRDPIAVPALGLRLPVTVSVGAAAGEGMGALGLFAAADQALFAAKQRGRDRVVAAIRAADAARSGDVGIAGQAPVRMRRASA
jgi:two-component system, cell cycle response regulator